MAKSKLSSMSLDKLVALRSEIDAEISRKKREDKKKVLAEVSKILASNDMTLDDLKAAPARRRKAAAPKRKVPPKYRNPKKKTETWTGRGRKPKWVEAHLAGGGKVEDLLIK